MFALKLDQIEAMQDDPLVSITLQLKEEGRFKEFDQAMIYLNNFYDPKFFCGKIVSLVNIEEMSKAITRELGFAGIKDFREKMPGEALTLNLKSYFPEDAIRKIIHINHMKNLGIEIIKEEEIKIPNTLLRRCTLSSKDSNCTINSFEEMAFDGQNLLLNIKGSLDQYSIHTSSTKELEMMIAFCLKRHNDYIESQKGKEIPDLTFPIKV